MKTIIIGDKLERGDMIYRIKNYNTFIYKDAINNCKHCYLDNMSGISTLLERNESNDAETILTFFKDIFIINEKVTFGVNLCYKGNIDTLSKHFVLISCVAIPTGYGTGKQYHAIFFTNCNARDFEDKYRKRFTNEGIIVTSSNDKITTKERPKTVFSNEDLIKIMAYKTKTYLKKFLERKIN